MYKINISDEDIIKCQTAFLLKTVNMTNTMLLKILRNKRIIQFYNQNSYYSNNVCLLEGYIIRKRLMFNKLGNTLFNNEVKALRLLYPYNNFPKLIAYDERDLIIYMTYCGPQISITNIPSNWCKQYEIIKNNLRKVCLNPNDILQRNICVLHNVIYIIDFGLCNIFKDGIEYSLARLYNQLLYLSNTSNRNINFVEKTL